MPADSWERGRREEGERSVSDARELCRTYHRCFKRIEPPKTEVPERPMFRERELRMQQWLIEMIRIVVVKGFRESRESPAFYYSLPVCVLHSVRGTTPERPRPWESFCGFGTNCCRVEFRSLSRALLSTAAAEHTVTPQALLQRESKSHSGGTRSLSTE